MKMSAPGRKALMVREGVRLEAYRDSIGVLTIGAGHTSAAGKPVVTPGLTITADECDAILTRDLVQYEDAVVKGLKRSVGQNAFDAMVSLCFNVGPANFAKSSVLRLTNAGDMVGAADAFLAWDKAGGRVLPGLSRRRAEERAQFLKPDAPVTTLAVHELANAPAPEPTPKPDNPQPSVWARLLATANRPAA